MNAVGPRIIKRSRKFERDQEIRRVYDQGKHTQAQLGEMFFLSRERIANIVQGEEYLQKKRIIERARHESKKL